MADETEVYEFKVGDLVVWKTGVDVAPIHREQRGEGPWEITKVTNHTEYSKAIGHMQWVYFDEWPQSAWSGAYFQKVETSAGD